MSLNLYAYCFNNPITYTDPTGHWGGKDGKAKDEDMNDDAKARIIALTNAWNATKSAAEKERIHQEAEKVRADPESWKQKDTLIEIKGMDDFNKAIANGTSNGYITETGWNNALSAIGATVDVKTSQTTPMKDVSLTSTNVTTTIDKADIDVTVKYAKSTTNISNSNVGVNTSIETHYSAYFFYIPEWKDNMEDGVKALANYYNISEDDIGTASISNSSEFTESWNMIGKAEGDKNVSAVVISTHGSPSGLYNNSGATIVNNSQISRLDNKSIDNLLLLGCNVGHLDHKDNNPASNFAQKINGGTVIASDGTVASGGNEYRRKYLFGLIDAGKTYGSVNDRNFQNEILTGTRDNIGWVTYKYIGGKISISDSLGKELTIKEMLKKMK